MAMDKNAHRGSKAQSMYNEAMGGGGKAAPMVGKMPMKNNKMGTGSARLEARAVKKPMMKADGGSVSMQEMAAQRHPIMSKKGGKVVKRAMGGVGKFRHDVAGPTGAPKAVPRGKMGRGI